MLLQVLIDTALHQLRVVTRVHPVPSTVNGRPAKCAHHQPALEDPAAAEPVRRRTRCDQEISLDTDQPHWYGPAGPSVV